MFSTNQQVLNKPVNPAPPATPFFQPKLTVNHPGDAFEQEADAVADRVVQSLGVAGPLHANQPAPAISRLMRKCAECEKEEAGDVLRKERPGDVSAGKAAPPSVQKALAGAGRPLPEDTQNAMENSFGRDFSEVRVHTDGQAAASAGDIQAKAYTSGSNIVFNRGEYAPDTAGGRRLLAHELTHVVQQGAAQERAVQRDETETGESGSGTFDFDFELLPPELQLRLGGLMLHADTSEAELRFTNNLVRYRLGYSYGGDLYFGAREGGFSSRLGVNPSTGGMSLGLSEGRFRFGTSFNPFSGGFGFNLGYGSPLLPMPGDLSSSVYGGWGGASGILGGLPGFTDPFSFYRANEENVDAVMGAVRALRPLADPERRSFGAGLRFTYNPDSGVLIHAGMQWFF